MSSNSARSKAYRRVTAVKLASVATEKLNLKGMTKKAKKNSTRKRQKAGQNLSILDVGMGMLRQAIEYKVLEAGGLFVEVPTLKVKPSQTCPSCGLQSKKELSERIHSCPCGFTCDRDVAAAIVMLNWVRGFWRLPPELDSAPARARGQELSSLNVDGSSSTCCGSLKQLVQMKRKKLQAQPEGGLE